MKFKFKTHDDFFVHKNSNYSKFKIFKVLSLKKKNNPWRTDKQLCKDHGMSLSSLYRWQRQFKNPGDVFITGRILDFSKTRLEPRLS